VLLLLLLCLVAVGAACRTPSARKPEASGPAAEVVSLRRTACYGRCPVYTVTLYEDGQLRWEGERHVATVGVDTAQLSPAEVTAVKALFEKAGWKTFEPSYDRHDVTDLPSAVVRYGGKTVQHYQGDSSAPQALSELEDALDAALHATEWVGAAPSERQML
jgi:hypothetical protein